jgi:hypothetical protein
MDGSGFNPRHPSGQIARSVPVGVLDDVKGAMHRFAVPFSDPDLVNSQEGNICPNFRAFMENTYPCEHPWGRSEFSGV